MYQITGIHFTNDIRLAPRCGTWVIVDGRVNYIKVTLSDGRTITISSRDDGTNDFYGDDLKQEDVDFLSCVAEVGQDYLDGVEPRDGQYDLAYSQLAAIQDVWEKTRRFQQMGEDADEEDVSQAIMELTDAFINASDWDC